MQTAKIRKYNINKRYKENKAQIGEERAKQEYKKEMSEFENWYDSVYDRKKCCKYCGQYADAIYEYKPEKYILELIKAFFYILIGYATF